MRNYVITSGTVFGLIVLAHVARVLAEGTDVISDPFFAVSTGLAVALCVWAVRLLRTRSL